MRLLKIGRKQDNQFWKSNLKTMSREENAVLDDSIKNLSAEDIKEWLKKNPEFLSENPDVLSLLNPPSIVDGQDEEQDNVVDFQRLLVDKLRRDHREAVETQHMLVEHSRDTLNNQNRIHAAILHLLDAASFEEFIHIITADLSLTLDVDVICLGVESDDTNIPHRYLSGVRLFNSGDVDKILGDRNAVLESDIRGDEYIFGEAAGLVHSQALMRLVIHPKVPQGILAFGSRDAQGFTPDQGIDQVSFLARVIERCIRAWLNLPS